MQTEQCGEIEKYGKFGMRRKKQSEETVKTAYNSVVDVLYPYREPLERVVSIVKKAAVLAGIVVVCLNVMTVGDGDLPDTEQQELAGAGNVDGEKFANGTDEGAGSAPRMLNISIVDEFPPESELEVRVIEEGQSIAEEESDSIFVQVTTQHDAEHDSFRLMQEDGSIKEDDGLRVEINTVQFFVPEGGTYSFGVPNFSTSIYGEGEWETLCEIDEINVVGDECEDFNTGIDAARQLINEGYLNDEISELLGRFPDIDPFGREYTLRLIYAGETYREEDQTLWWDVEYGLYTTADNGEVLLPLTVEIYDVTVAQGIPDIWDDAHYRLWAYEHQLWQLMEDPVKDKGEVMLQQIRGDSFASEESINRFVEEQGAAFFLPEGVDTEVEWSCRRQEEFYYDYLVWAGETADYEVTLAIPLMEKRDEGYYLASYIRKEAEDKETCRHILSGMMQTFRGREYLHVVKEGESLCKIAEKYLKDQGLYSSIWLYNENNDAMESFLNPDLIYPGQKVYLSSGIQKYDATLIQD